VKQQQLRQIRNRKTPEKKMWNIFQQEAEEEDDENRTTKL